MEELLKLVELVRQEAPQTRLKVDSLMITHYFTMEELLNICNKYADYKCAFADVVEQSEQLFCPECENPYPHSHTDNSQSCEDCGHKWAK